MYHKHIGYSFSGTRRPSAAAAVSSCLSEGGLGFPFLVMTDAAEDCRTDQYEGVKKCVAQGSSVTTSTSLELTEEPSDTKETIAAPLTGVPVSSREKVPVTHS